MATFSIVCHREFVRIFRLPRIVQVLWGCRSCEKKIGLGHIICIRKRNDKICFFCFWLRCLGGSVNAKKSNCTSSSIQRLNINEFQSTLYTFTHLQSESNPSTIPTRPGHPRMLGLHSVLPPFFFEGFGNGLLLSNSQSRTNPAHPAILHAFVCFHCGSKTIIWSQTT